MAEFTPIETQEMLDSIIGERLKREKDKNSELTAGFQSTISELESKNAELSKTIEGFNEKYAGIDEKISEYEKKIREYESDSVKTRIAREVGIPYEMRDRLRGETEEEIKADAESLLKMIPKPSSPSKRTEVREGKSDTRESAFREMLNNNM